MTLISAKAPLLSVEALQLETDLRSGPHRTLLHDLTFHVQPGVCTAMVGESGSGKTLAARAILSLLPPGVRRVSGAIHFAGSDLAALSPRELRRIRGSSIGMVFQEPLSSLNPAITVGRQLLEGLRLHRRLSAGECRRRACAMLERVRIQDPERCLSAYPHEFSGGMRQRIMLASVLLLEPRLLIADEPTTALDTLSQREVLDLMTELTRNANIATLLITHNLGLVARYAAEVIVLEHGHLRESGPTAQVLTEPAHPYTRRLLAARPNALRHTITQTSRPPVVLEVEGACISYPGKRRLFRVGTPRQIVHGASFCQREGEIVALVGASGSGKTTLGRAILGLKKLAQGSIRVCGQDIASLTPEAYRRYRAQAQLIFQDPYSSLDPRIRIADSIAAPLRVQGVPADEKRKRVEAVLEEVGLAGFGNRFPHQMSGGQRQRVAIARAIISRPRLVVADEPVSALDMTIQAQVLTLLQRLQRDYGFACLFITHDLSVVAQIASHVLVMSAGRIVECGPTAEVLSRPQHDYTRSLIAATPLLPNEAPMISGTPP
jgi:peptide/nickel transport system ATP-binding protein